MAHNVQRTSSFTGHPGSARASMGGLGPESSFVGTDQIFGSSNSAPITPRSPGFGYQEEVSSNLSKQQPTAKGLCSMQTAMPYQLFAERQDCMPHTVLLLILQDAHMPLPNVSAGAPNMSRHGPSKLRMSSSDAGGPPPLPAVSAAVAAGGLQVSGHAMIDQ